jgi:hypothetical protein
MFDFSKLPIDVYYVTRCYLSSSDYHKFLNTSKSLFSEVKHQTVVYHLKYDDPFDQAEAEIISDIVTSRVKNRNTQISISYRFDSRFSESSNNHSARLNLHIPIDIHTLKLMNCYHNDNVCFTGREGGYLNTLEIYGDMSVIPHFDLFSLSVFPFLQTLVLNDCYINSISPLMNIPSVELCNVELPGIGGFNGPDQGDLADVFRDVTKVQLTRFDFSSSHHAFHTPFISTLLVFKDIQDLSLEGEFLDSEALPSYRLSCQSLRLINRRDLSYFPLHLEKPKQLFLSNFNLKDLVIDNLIELEEVHLLHCSNVNMGLFTFAKKIEFDQGWLIPDGPVKVYDFISFHLLEFVSLSRCDIAVEVGLFSKVHTVKFNHCMNLSSLQGLGNSTTDEKNGNRHVSVADCVKVTDFSPLNGLHRVEIQSCPGFCDGNQVKDVKNLLISNCKKIESFHMFGKVHSLRIYDCQHLSTLYGLQDVPYLDIRVCNKLKEIAGLKNNQYVNIKHCTLLNHKREYYNNYFSFLPHFLLT